jgi:hypothetical protein
MKKVRFGAGKLVFKKALCGTLAKNFSIDGETNLTLEIWPINLVYYLEIELGENLVGGGGGRKSKQLGN